MTPSEEYTERYKKIERRSDIFGRVIGVGRLRESQKLRIVGMTSDLEGSEKLKGPDGVEFEVYHRTKPMLAAMVREIDGHPYPFPRNRAELDALIDKLDEPGFTAIVDAISVLNGSIPASSNEDVDVESI